MGAERKTQQRTFESRRKLLDAAYNLFVQKGYYNTNTKEIASYAGISIGNFYNYYHDKGEIYGALLEGYTADSCKAMQELADHLLTLESRVAYKDFLSSYLRQLIERAADINKFFEDSLVIAKENTLVQSIISKAEENMIDIMETFFKKLHPNSQNNYYIRARMIYVITDQVAKDILRIINTTQKEKYIQIFVNEIVHFTFDF